MSDTHPASWQKAIIAGVATGIATVGAYYVVNKTFELYRTSVRKSRRDISDLLEDFQKNIATPPELLKKVSETMMEEMKSGLLQSSTSRLQMLTTFVDRLPTGVEKGVYYALDLGGTNFRVLRVELGGSDTRILRDDQFSEVSIPEDRKKGTTEALFDFIAGELAVFVQKYGSNDVLAPGKSRELGFTFSFPVEQTAINRGRFIKWTKGFDVSGTEGRDIVEILEEAIARQNLNMRVNALVNDTVGTLAGAHYWDSDTKVAVILGTGTNACYIEEAEAIQKWTGPRIESGVMVINMEWGNYYKDFLPMTFADKELDRESTNPGEQVYEKLISGMYLGEIARRILLSFAVEGKLFGDEVPAKLREENSFTTPLLSKIDGDSTTGLKVVENVLDSKLGISRTSLLQRKVVHAVCESIAERGARLAAAGIVGVLKQIGRDASDTRDICADPRVHLQKHKTKVAVDGGLYEHYPKFRDHMHKAVSELLGPEATGLVTIELSKDGSGIGAALLAASSSSA